MNGFDRIVGYDELKAEMMIMCDSMKNPEKYKKLGATIPRGMLLYGEPGIGKSLLAKTFAEETGRTLHTVRKDKPNGEFVNFIRETFVKAKENAPSVVFLDDMDKFANGDEAHKDAEEYVTVQACIDDAREAEVFVIATVNDINVLPDSLLRPGRFDKVIELECPRGEDAVKIFEYFLSRKNIVEDIDAREIANILEGKSCANLENIVNEAGLYAAYDGRDRIAHNDLLRACLRNIYGAPEKPDYFDENQKRITAVHEAGHAVIAEILDPGTVNLISIAGYGGGVNGITSTSLPKGYWNSMELMEHRVIHLLGGKAATEVVSGTIDVGVSSDIRRAYDVVERFVTDYCSCGFSSYVRHHSSDLPREERDRKIVNEIERYYQEAMKILRDNRAFLDALVEALMNKQTVSGRDVKAIKERVYGRAA